MGLSSFNTPWFSTNQALGYKDKACIVYSPAERNTWKQNPWQGTGNVIDLQPLVGAQRQKGECPSQEKKCRQALPSTQFYPRPTLKISKEPKKCYLTICGSDCLSFSLSSLPPRLIHQENAPIFIFFKIFLMWKVKSLSCVGLFATPWTVAYQVPLSMGFSRQEYWSGLPVPSPGKLPDPEVEPRCPALQADALPSEPPGK